MQIEHRSLSLGEVLDGDRMAKSLYDIKFGTNIDLTTLCTVKLNEKELESLELAIEDLYYFEFVVGKPFDESCVAKLVQNRLVIVAECLSRRHSDERIHWTT